MCVQQHYAVGDRVKVVWPTWEGEGVVTRETKPMSGAPSRLLTLVRLETGKMKGCEGGFEPKDLEPLAPPKPLGPSNAELAKIWLERAGGTSITAGGHASRQADAMVGFGYAVLALLEKLSPTEE